MNHPQHLPDPSNRQTPVNVQTSIQMVLPVAGGLHNRHMPIFPVTTINEDSKNTTPGPATVPFKVVPVIKVTDYNRWHHHLARNPYENTVRLIAAFTRIIAVCTGFLFAFDSAGINIFSMLASVGILALCFSYGAGSLLGNYFAYVMTLITNKTKRHEWISYGGYQGFVSSMGGNNMEITNDLDPWKGRQVHQIPNKTQVDGVITIYPDGPPPELIKAYFEKLNEVNGWRTSFGMEPLEQSIEASAIASKFSDRATI
jgi:small-conductance mechanosensitive channel